MRLTPKEMDRLTIFSVAEMARRRRDRGVKLNHPEAVALICDEMMECARDGRSYEEVAQRGATLLTRDDVMDGVAELADPILLEVTFLDGNKLVMVRDPIRERGTANEAR